MSRTLVAAALVALAACSNPAEKSEPSPAKTHGSGAPTTDAPPPPEKTAVAGPQFGTATPSANAPEVKPTEERTDPRTACIDKWLGEHQLNAYGDPPDTNYAGGTPLFDEATGQRQDRLGYIAKKHPQIRAACPPVEPRPADGK